jgi:hypothetical protein
MQLVQDAALLPGDVIEEAIKSVDSANDELRRLNLEVS